MNRAQTRAVATDGATVAATLLFDAVSREKRQCPREPRGIVEPGKVPGSGLHRQLGMLEETGILGRGGSPMSYSPASNGTGFQDRPVRSS